MIITTEEAITAVKHGKIVTNKVRIKFEKDGLTLYADVDLLIENGRSWNLLNYSTTKVFEFGGPNTSKVLEFMLEASKHVEGLYDQQPDVIPATAKPSNMFYDKFGDVMGHTSCNPD